MAELIKRLQKIGWSAEPVDICWMACPRPGHRRAFGEYEIVLCRPHIEELESTSQSKNGVDYAIAAYPASVDDSLEAWWPWRDQQSGEVVDFL